MFPRWMGNGLIGFLSIILLAVLYYLSPCIAYTEQITIDSIFRYHEFFKTTTLSVFLLMNLLMIYLVPASQYQNKILLWCSFYLVFLFLIYYIFQAFLWNPEPKIFYFSSFFIFLFCVFSLLICLQVWFVFFCNHMRFNNFDVSKQYRIFFKPFPDCKKYKLKMHYKGLQLWGHVGIWDGKTQTFYSFRKNKENRVKKQEDAINYIRDNIICGNIINIKEVKKLNNIDDLIDREYNYKHFNCIHFIKQSSEV